MKEIRQTKEYANYLASQGWIIEKIHNENVFIKKLPLIGSLLKYQRPQKPDIAKLYAIAKKYRSLYLLVELYNKNDLPLFKENGFTTTSPYLPTKTRILDITDSIKNIRAQLDKDARYALRKTEKERLKEETDLKTFYDDWKKAAARSRYILSVSQLRQYKNSFGQHMILLTNEKGDSGAMFLVADKIGYYWYGFTSDSARATLIQYKIIFEGIKWAKKNGAKQFDFEGIYDSRFPNKAWLGFSTFKKKFGGKEKEYPESVAKIVVRNIFK